MIAPIFDPVEEARALAFHMGREREAQREPTTTPIEAAAELRSAEIECVMAQVPHEAPIRSVTA